MLKNIAKMMVFFLYICVSSYIIADETNKKKLCINVLDPKGIFEDKFFFNQTNSIYEKAPVTVKQVFGSGLKAKVYEIKRDYLPTDNNKFVDMNGPEEYLLCLFNTTTIKLEDITINIAENPMYSTWFSNYLHITIQNNFISKDKKEGMLPFLNINNLKLLDKPLEDEEVLLSEDDLKDHTSVAINHFFEIAGGVARQLALQENFIHENILAVNSIKGMKLIDPPKDTLINYIYNSMDNKYDIIKLTSFMYNIVNTLKYVHKNEIAHGDLKLSNLFVKKNKIILSGFERFSVYNNKYKNLGTKKFTFYNNIYHAPEIRFPIDKNSKWDYTTATYKGDIYSLGMIFAGILYLCFSYSEYNFDLLKVTKEKLATYVYNEYVQSALFDRHPNSIKNKIKTIFPKKLLANFYFYQKQVVDYWDTEETSQLEIFLEIITIINQCHQDNPERRPTAEKIADNLHDIIQRYTADIKK
jgi:serine/threonine protein kinase